MDGVQHGNTLHCWWEYKLVAMKQYGDPLKNQR